MVHAVSRRPLKAEARVRARFGPCGFCGVQSDTGTDFSPSSPVFSCQYHSTAAHHTHISRGRWTIDSVDAVHTHTPTPSTWTTTTTIDTNLSVYGLCLQSLGYVPVFTNTVYFSQDANLWSKISISCGLQQGNCLPPYWMSRAEQMWVLWNLQYSVDYV
jgi:hypothetical protein